MAELFELREEFNLDTLEEDKLPSRPISLFEKWIQTAIDQNIADANATILSTCNKEGRPSSRVVLLKYFDKGKFVFFTNYESKKGKELKENPNASLLFYWPLLQKQIRVEGPVEKTTSRFSENYFEKRPLKSRISAIVSPQSREIAGRHYLEERFTKYMKNNPTPHRPENWGGYALKPDFFEFWQGRQNRLHDRIAYYKNVNGWIWKRLAP